MSVLLDALTDAVGTQHVLTDRDLRASYETDWTGRFGAPALCVVRPADTAQVVAVLRACAAADATVVVQGGRTGLVGGSVPAGGEVLLSLARLTEIGPVDLAAQQVTVGAGVTLSALQATARSAGLEFGLDLAARDSATVGGLVATNAGGIRVPAHGSMRAQVAGAEAVLADGSVLTRLGGLPKDGTGYDLPGLFCGSEGTLGVLTRLRVKLVAPPAAPVVALVAVASVEAAQRVLGQVRGRVAAVLAAELFFADGLDLVRAGGALPAPFAQAYPAYLTVEVEGGEDALLAGLAASEDVLDATVAADGGGQRRLWAYREAHTEAVNAAGIPVKLDVAVPAGVLAEFIAKLPAVVSAILPAARLITFGHLNEANMHVNILGALEVDEQITDAVLQLVASYDGSISSEHGIGRAKLPWLGLSRSAAEIAAMSALKAALDPTGMLNPGVLLPPPTTL